MESGTAELTTGILKDLNVSTMICNYTGGSFETLGTDSSNNKS